MYLNKDYTLCTSISNVINRSYTKESGDGGSGQKSSTSIVAYKKGEGREEGTE